MRAHTSDRVTSFVTMIEMQCAGVRSYILQGTKWAMQFVPSSRKTYPCQNEAKIKQRGGHILHTGSSMKEKNICTRSIYFSTTFSPLFSNDFIHTPGEVSAMTDIAKDKQEQSGICEIKCS
jgi:hypothetical protein